MAPIDHLLLLHCTLPFTSPAPCPICPKVTKLGVQTPVLIKNKFSSRPRKSNVLDFLLIWNLHYKWDFLTRLTFHYMTFLVVSKYAQTPSQLNFNSHFHKNDHSEIFWHKTFKNSNINQQLFLCRHFKLTTMSGRHLELATILSYI